MVLVKVMDCQFFLYPGNFQWKCVKVLGKSTKFLQLKRDKFLIKSPHTIDPKLV